jgi:hypothetical protein
MSVSSIIELAIAHLFVEVDVFSADHPVAVISLRLRDAFLVLIPFDKVLEGLFGFVSPEVRIWPDIVDLS